MPPSKASKASKARGRPKASPKRPSSRSSRSRQLARTRARRSIRRRLLAAGVLVAVVAAIAVTSLTSSDGGVVAELEAGGCGYDTDPRAEPPAGGDASADAAEPGFYRKGESLPADAALVRSMRRGFTVLWYGDAARDDVLNGLSERFGRELIVVPRQGLATTYAVTAWERRLRCDGHDDAAMARFVDSFRDRGPEKGFL